MYHYLSGTRFISVSLRAVAYSDAVSCPKFSDWNNFCGVHLYTYTPRLFTCTHHLLLILLFVVPLFLAQAEIPSKTHKQPKMADSKGMALPCDTNTGICNCTDNMDPVFMNSTNFTSDIVYECGYYVGLNSWGERNVTIHSAFVSDPQSNTTGWYCGKGKDKIFPNTKNYNVYDMYKCGYMDGRENGKDVANEAAAGTRITKTLLVVALLSTISYFS